jgi:hypothetical protein
MEKKEGKKNDKKKKLDKTNFWAEIMQVSTGDSNTRL